MLRKVMLAIPVIAAIIYPVYAHDWYPMECCSGMDCAPVEKVERIPDPSNPTALPLLLVTTKHGTVAIPTNFPLRQSQDNRMHVCMRPSQTPGVNRLLCVFIPPGQ